VWSDAKMCEISEKPRVRRRMVFVMVLNTGVAK
jgi:hypothetical protein